MSFLVSDLLCPLWQKGSKEKVIISFTPSLAFGQAAQQGSAKMWMCALQTEGFVVSQVFGLRINH